MRSAWVLRSVANPWTGAHQAPPSMGSPDKNTGVGGHALLQAIFPTQGSNPYLSCLLCPSSKASPLPLLQLESPGAWIVPCFWSQHPAFVPSFLEVDVGFSWSFSILSLIYPSCTGLELCLVPVVSLYFVAQGDICPGASTAAKCLRSQVSDCLFVAMCSGKLTHSEGQCR